MYSDDEIGYNAYTCFVLTKGTGQGQNAEIRCPRRSHKQTNYCFIALRRHQNTSLPQLKAGYCKPCIVGVLLMLANLSRREYSTIV